MIRSWLVLTVLACPVSAQDATPPPPATSFGPAEVLAVTPGRRIDHDVELKGKLDSERVETYLTGPEAFSKPVKRQGDTYEKIAVPFNWYRIVKPTEQPERQLTVRTPDGKEMAITIGAAAFLITPSQVITTGAPDSMPDDISCFRAYKVLKAPQGGGEVRLLDALGPEKRTKAEPIYVCLPVEQWHHEEHMPVRNWNGGFIVYRLDSQKLKANMTTLDQFGLNRLQVAASSWLCEPVRW